MSRILDGNAKLDDPQTRRRVLEQELCLALHRDQLTMSYQPLVDIVVLRVVGLQGSYFSRPPADQCRALLIGLEPRTAITNASRLNPLLGSPDFVDCSADHGLLLR